MLAAGMLPNPAGGLAQAGIWLVVAWVFLFRTDVVGVMAPEEYAYVDAYTQILRRIHQRKHASGRRNPAESPRRFEADVQSIAALSPPPAWVQVQSDTVRELERRLTVMKLGTPRSAGELRAIDDGWLEVGQQFRDSLKVRAAFWNGWPFVVRRSRA